MGGPRSDLERILLELERNPNPKLLEQLLADPEVQRGFHGEQRATDRVERVRCSVVVPAAPPVRRMFVDPALRFAVAHHRRDAALAQDRLAIARREHRAKARRPARAK